MRLVSKVSLSERPTNSSSVYEGRLRPDFLARCQWNEILQSCTGFVDCTPSSPKPLDSSNYRTARAILDGRKSFPSGHSSTAFSGMMFLSLWIAGKTAAWCFHVPLPAASIRSSRMGSLSLTLMPLFWASFVAISRIEDYVRNILASCFTYLRFPSETSQGRRRRGQPYWHHLVIPLLPHLLAQSIFSQKLYSAAFRAAKKPLRCRST